MPWRCPACGDSIQHTPLESAPRPATLYRCHICRLELIFDPALGRLVLAPLDEEPPPDKRQRKSE